MCDAAGSAASHKPSHNDVSTLTSAQSGAVQSASADDAQTIAQDVWMLAPLPQCVMFA